MAFTRATYNSETVTKVSDSSQLATNQTKYWNTEEGVSESVGVWDTTNNKFIPDGFYDSLTGWLWMSGSLPSDADLKYWETL
jgi:hypothetical protein|tara:strand:+ start:690 stop:935 length:246 start_codon:yes stop_codon:yes gene_type:complete